MSASDTGALARPVLAAIALTLVTQVVSSMALMAPSVIAPLAAPDLGVRPERIGFLVAISYALAMLCGLLAPAAVARFGAVRVCQLALVIGAVGLLVGASGALSTAILGAILIGAGYGLVNPATSQILARVSPPAMLALIFSIKQTGVPVGGALAGAILPSLSSGIGWPGALVSLAVVSVVVGFAAVRFRNLDRGHARGSTAVTFRSIVLPLRLVCGDPRLLELALVSLAYSAMQVTLFAYLVSYMNVVLGHSLVAAGFIYSATQLAAIAGRIVWGALADRLRRPRRILGLLGVLTACLAVVLALFGDAFDTAALTVFCIVLGATAIGWNGVQLAEVARNAPRGDVGLATAGSQFLTFTGALSGPALFGLLVPFLGYSYDFALFALAPLSMGLVLLLRPRPPRADDA